MWTRSGVSGTGRAPSKSEKRRTNGGSQNSNKNSKSDSSKSSSRSFQGEPGPSRSQGEVGAAKSSKYSSSKAGQDLIPEADNEAPSSPSNLPHDASLILNQFPDQTPLDYSIPSIRPATSSSGFGLAADYYNDQGQSVQRQPGVRPHTPIITGAEPHLMAALVESNPPEETGHGAAAEFYSNNDMAPSETSYQTAPLPYSATVTAGGDAAGAMALTEASGSTNAPRPTIPQGSSSKARKRTGTSIPLLAAGAAAGAASLGAAAYAHHNRHKSASQYDAKFGPSSSGGRRSPSRRSTARSQTEKQRTIPYGAEMTRSFQGQPRELRSPVSRFVDWWNNYEDIRKMEEYTEYIGVCRYCFDPQSDPHDAPRRHRPHRRASRGSFRDRGRVDKESRYGRASSASSSDSERGKQSRVDATGLTGLGLAAAMNGKQRKESYDSNIKTERLAFQGPDEAIQNRLSYHPGSSDSRDVIGNDSHLKSTRSQVEHQDLRGTELGGKAMTTAGGNDTEAFVLASSPSVRRRSSASRATRLRKGSSASSAGERSSSDGDAKLGFLGKLFSPRSKKKPGTSRRQPSGIYQNNSATSSLVSGLAYGREDSHTRPGKARREPTARDASNAILGLGAAAALLASADSKRNRTSARIPDLIAVRESKSKRSKQPLTRDSLSQLQEQSDDGWEDASDNSRSSSLDTGLAFGDFHYGSNTLARRRSASINSTGSATDKWDWRWGRKVKKTRHAISPTDIWRESEAIPPTIVASPPIVADASDGSRRHHADSAVDPETQGPLRYIEPRPISDFNSPTTAGIATAPPLRAEGSDSTLQHPRPIPAVGRPLYSNEEQLDTFVARSADVSHAYDGSKPKPSRIETLPGNYSDSPFPSGYNLPGQNTGPLSSGGSAESPTGSRQIDSPRLAAQSESQSLIRDAAITGVVSAAAAGAVSTVARNRRRTSRQNSQSVRFATEGPRGEGYAGGTGQHVREAPSSDTSEQRMQVQTRVAENIAPHIDAIETEILNVDQRPAYGTDEQERATQLGDIEEKFFQSSSTQPQAIDALPTVPGGFEASLAEVDDLVRIQSEPQLEIRHQGQIRTDHEPILDDEIFDPNFFKRSRAASEPQSGGRQRSASFVVADLESRYTTKSPSMAEFFAPPELMSSASVLDRRIDAEIDPKSPVDITDPAFGTRDLSSPSTTVSREGRVMASIPRLNVIAPTPPSSYAGSAKDPLSRSTSPAAEPDLEETVIGESTTGEPSSVSQVRWAGEQLSEPETVETHDVEPKATDLSTGVTEDSTERSGTHERRSAQFDNTSEPLTTGDVTSSTVRIIAEENTTESNTDSSNVLEEHSSSASENRSMKSIFDSAPHEKDAVLPRLNSPPEANQAFADSRAVIGASSAFEDKSPSLEADKSSPSIMPDQQPADYEKTTRTSFSTETGYEDGNDVPPVTPGAKQSKSGKKNKKLKKRQTQLSTGPWEDDADNDSGRMSRVPGEKVNTSFPENQKTSDYVAVDVFQVAPPVRDMAPDVHIDSTGQDSSSPLALLGSTMNRSTDSLLELERGFQRIPSSKDTQHTSSEVFTFPESYHDVPEMIRLPDSPPESPYGFNDSGAALGSLESIRSPKSPTLGRTPSSTAVPLPFYRRTPQSPWLNRESPVPSSAANEQSPTSVARTRTSRPSSMDFKSDELRPLYLLERNRKATQPDPEEDLPPLPSSHSTSRASSVLDSDETFESALESLEHSPVLQDRSMDRGDPFDGDIPNVEYLDSQQATPKAMAVSEDASDIPNQPLDEERSMQQLNLETDPAVISVGGEDSLHQDGGDHFSPAAGQEKEQAFQSSPTHDIGTLGSGASEGRSTAATQESNGDDEEFWWTSQSSRAKRGKKTKKGKKGRPAPIESSSHAEKQQATAAIPDFTIGGEADNGDNERTMSNTELSNSQDLVAEPPLTARLATSDGDHRTDDRPISGQFEEAAEDKVTFASSDDIEDTIVRHAPLGPDNDATDRKTDAGDKEDLEMKDYRDRNVSYSRSNLLLDASERAIDETNSANEGLGIYSIAHSTIAETKAETDEVNALATPTLPATEDFAVLQHRPSNDLEQKAVDSSVQDETTLDPPELTTVNILVNRGQSESEEQSGVPEADNTEISLNETPLAMSYTADKQVPDTVHDLSLPESAKNREGIVSDNVSPLAEQQQAVEDDTGSLQGFSWVSKSNKKKEKKGKKNKQSSMVQDQELESGVQSATEPLKPGDETRPLVASDADWELPSKSKKKKGKKIKTVVPLATVLDASDSKSTPAIHDAVEEYILPANASRVDLESQATTLEGDETVQRQELQLSRPQEQSFDDQSIEKPSENLMDDEFAPPKATEISHSPGELHEKHTVAAGDVVLDAEAFGSRGQTSSTLPTLTSESQIASIDAPTEVVADDEWSVSATSKKKKDKKKKKKIRPDTNTDNFDDMSIVTHPPAADESARSLSSTEAYMRDEVSMPPESGNKKGKKKLRFSLEPDVQISTDPNADDARPEAPRSSVTYSQEDTIRPVQSSPIFESAIGTNDRIPSTIVPGAFPEEAEDYLEPHDPLGSEVLGADTDTREFLDRLRDEENQSPIPKNYGASTSEEGPGSMSMPSNTTLVDTLDETTWREQEQGAEVESEMPHYGTNTRPGAQRVMTSDFLEELREEEDQASTPFATTASYAEGEPHEDNYPPLEQAIDKTQKFVAPDQDTPFSVDSEYTELEVEDDWATTTKSKKKKSKKNKRRNVLEPVQAVEAARDEILDAEDTEITLPTDELALEENLAENRQGDEWKDAQNPLQPDFTDVTAAETENHPLPMENPESSKGKERERDEKDNETSISSLDVPEQENSSRNTSTLNSDSAARSVDIADFMEQEDAIEEGFGDSGIHRMQPEFDKTDTADDNKTIRHLDSNAKVAVENDRVGDDHPRPDSLAEQILEEEKAREGDHLKMEQDHTEADEDDTPLQSMDNEEYLDTINAKADTFLDNERALEEDYVSYTETRRSLSPDGITRNEPSVAESAPTPIPKKSKKEKKKAKKVKKNQSMSVDEFQSRVESDEKRSRSSTSLGQTPDFSKAARAISPMAAEYAEASNSTQTKASEERQNPLPVTLTDVLALPVLSSATGRQTPNYEGTSVRRSQSISKLWPSHASELVEIQPRSSSESRKPVTDNVGFMTALAAGLQASGFDPRFAVHGSRDKKFPPAPEPVSAMQIQESDKLREASGKGLSAYEPTWSFNRLDHEEHDHGLAEDEKMAQHPAQHDDPTFTHIVAFGLGSAGFDPRAIQQNGPSDLNSDSGEAVKSGAAALEAEVEGVSMRAQSPNSPADQWLNSSRPGSPQKKRQASSNVFEADHDSRSVYTTESTSEKPGAIFDPPWNRDSAMEVSESPQISASRPSQQGTRDSGYHDTMPTTPTSRTSEFQRFSSDSFATSVPHVYSPVEPMSKERTSSLFQSYRDDLEKQGREGLQATVEDVEDLSHATYPSVGRSSGTSPVSLTAHSRSESRELDTIVEDSGEGLRVDSERQRSPHETNLFATPSEVANSQRLYTRSPNNSSPTPDLARPPSALSARSRTPGSVVSNRSGSQGLRRSNPSSDLGAEYKRGEAQAPGYPSNAYPNSKVAESTAPERRPSYDPLKGLGRVSSRDMSDTGVYAGWGDARESPRSPTESQAVRKRQSLQIIDLENRQDQAMAENQSLQVARGLDGSGRGPERSTGVDFSSRDEELRRKDVEITTIRGSLETLQQEISRLTAHNEQLIEANRNLSEDANERYATVQAEHDDVHRQWQQTSRDLEQERDQHTALKTGMEAAVGKEISSALAAKNAEVQSLRDELAAAAEQIRSLQSQIQQSSSSRGMHGVSGTPEDFLNVRNDDYIDSACHQLCSHVQQWILRFSKFSDMRSCRLSPDIHNEAIEGRLDNAILDGADVDVYLSDRIKRRDVFMSLTMTMIWEYIFTRYLFGMERTQRQTLKTLEKTLSEVGPRRAVAQWRATTLTLLSQRESFSKQRETDTEAVVHEIFSTLSTLLPPPQNLVSQIVSSLRNVVRLAVDLSIEMRTQRPEYVMLPPLHPEYDTNGDLVRKVFFNAGLMNERSGNFTDNGALEVEERSVRIVLFPLVVRRGDEFGEGSEEVVVAPAQVLVSRTEEEERRSAGAARGNGANSSAKSVRGLGAEYNRSQMSIAPSATGSGNDAGSFV